MTCPVCGAGFAARKPPAPIRGKCEACRSLLVESRRPEPTLIPPRTGDDLDAAAEAVAERLRKHRAPAAVDPKLIKRFQTRPYARVVSVTWADDERDLIVVVERKWTTELARRLTLDLLRLDQEDAAADRVARYYFAAPHPAPAALRYTFSDDPRARFERAALCRVEFTTPEEIVPLAKVPVLVELAFELTRDRLGLALPLQSLSEVERIEGAVHRLLRLGVGRDKSLPSGRHVPHTSLLLLGLVYGELLGIGTRLPRKWVNDARAPYGLVLDLRTGATRAGANRFNPLGRVTKLYLKGESESLVQFTWSVLDQLKISAQ